MRTIWAGVSLAAMTIATSTALYAQETTSIIRGSVTNGGQPVSGAELTITNVPSGTVSRTGTDAAGLFSVAGLRTGGPYTVAVTSPAGNATITGIFAVIGQPFDLPIELAKDAAADEIVVTASSIKGAGVKSDGPQTVLGAVDISKVASINRDIRDIERRSPFATLDLSNSAVGAVSIAGTNPRFNRFTIDGVQVGDQFGLNPDASPTRRGPVPYDALAQVSISVAPYDIRQSNFQGGVIEATLASGTNTFHANGFYSQSTSGLQGNQIGSTFVALPHYKSETYGGTISGPIIKDKLFFLGSYERNTDPRPLSPGQVSDVQNLTQDQVTNIQSIAKSVYGYTTGDILPVTKNLDEKFVIRLDYNVTDQQKLSFSYINSYDAADSIQNSSTSKTSPSIGLASNAYKLTELLRAGIVRLNSDWTDRLSTETRFVYKAYTRGQDPELGRGFAQFRVCTAPTSIIGGTDSATSCGIRADGTGNPVVSFGPDNSRQTNALFTDTYDGSFIVRFKAGTHDFKGLFEYVENRTTDAFLQNSAGNYYFDSVTDFQNRNASQLIYQNALSLKTSDTDGNFKYGEYTVGLQDDWTISDALRITYGARYDLYQTSSPVAVNQNFINRYGFANNKSFDGLYSFQPRFSFNYEPDSDFSLRGGAGVFAGGTPDIYFSNSYQNTGSLSNSITVTRATPPTGGATASCSAPFTGANAAVCQAALNNVNGTLGSIPSTVNNYLSQNIASTVTQLTASVDPNFRIPSQTRLTLSADYKIFGINFGADYFYSRVNQAATFTDLRSRQIGVLPDGRPRYTFVATPGAGVQTADTNTDIQISNTTKGRSHIAVVRFDKDFQSGVSIGGSYSYQNVKDVSNASSTVAGSIYNQQAVSDPNNAAYGTSSDETRWAFKYSIGYDHAFFRDYRTVIQLFGETRAGRPFSYTMQDNTSGRSSVFGTTGNNDHYLLYVPTGLTDAKVSYDSTLTATALDTLITSTRLNGYRGLIANKNIDRSRANTRIDLHLEQEIPTFIGRSRLALFADIQNLPNLINKDWGGFSQVSFPQTAAVVQVQCLQAAVPTGAAPGSPNPAGGTFAPAAANSTQACAQYRYSSFRAPNETLTAANSLYLIRIGARFKF